MASSNASLGRRETSTTTQSHGDQLCEVCAAVDFVHLFRSAGSRTTPSINLGTISEVTARAYCPCCRLVASSFGDLWARGRYAEARESPRTWDHFQGSCLLSAAASRDESRAKTSPRLTLFLILPIEPLGEGPNKVVVRHMFLLHTDASKLGLHDSYHGRLISNEIDFGLVRSWLDACLVNHPDLETVEGGGSRQLPTSFRVIDVTERKLVQAPRHCRYVALSYVWGSGGTNTLRCLKSNIHSLRKAGALFSDKANVAEIIKSAMLFVAGLNERYLWVDALCVVQDDETDKGNQIARMETVYAKAFVTLVAASASSADHALCGLGKGPRRDSQVTARVSSDITLVAAPQDLPTLLRQSVWATRAWTFQEEVLSRRRIYVAHEQLYFECSKCSFCESLEGQSQRSDGAAGDVTLFNLLGKDRLSSYALRDELNVMGLVIRSFSQRSLSYASDIQNSFAGILSTWQDKSQWSFKNGLPMHYLHQTLLWLPETVVSRRTARLANGRAYSIFPSWSWMGWTGPVWFDADKVSNKDFFRNEVNSFGLRESVLPRRVMTKSSAQTLPVESPKAEDMKIDVLTFTSSSVRMTVSAKQALMIQGKGHRSHEIYHALYDRNDDHCGVAMGLNPLFFDDKPSVDLQCILLSSSMEFPTKPAETYAVRARKISLTVEKPYDFYVNQTEAEHDWPDRGSDAEYDYTKFEQKEWCALNVMLVQRFGNDLYERVALGQIHVDAWEAARPAKQEFRVA